MNSEVRYYVLDYLEKYVREIVWKVENFNSEVFFVLFKSYLLNGFDWKWYDILGLVNVEDIDLLIIDGLLEDI